MELPSLLYERLAASVQQRGSLSAARRTALHCIAASPERSWTAGELLQACAQREAGALSQATAYRVLTLLAGLGMLETDTSDRATQPAVQRYRLSSLALAETEISDGKPGGQRVHIGADRWLRRYAERLAVRHGLKLEEFRLELRGAFKPVRRSRK